MGATYRDTQLQDLPRRAELRYLSITLSDGWAETSRLKRLAQFPQIQSLAIGGPVDDRPFDGSGLSALAELPSLKTLRLVKLRDDGLLQLPMLQWLERLDLSQSRVRGECLAVLSRFPQMEILSLDHSTLTNSGLQHLPRLPNLQELRLDEAEIFIGSHIGSHEFVTRAERQPTAFSEAMLSVVLPRLPQLRRLSLAGLPISNQGLAQLQLAPRLQTLDLSRTLVTDEGLQHLKFVPELQELTIRRLPVTDQIFTVLGTLPAFRALHHSGTAITFRGAAAFHRQHPTCYIEDVWDPDLGSFGSYPHRRQ